MIPRSRIVSLLALGAICLAGCSSEEPAQAAAKVKASAFFVDEKARLDVADILTQVQWLKAEGLVDASVDAKSILDLSFIEGHTNVN